MIRGCVPGPKDSPAFIFLTFLKLGCMSFGGPMAPGISRGEPGQSAYNPGPKSHQPNFPNECDGRLCRPSRSERQL